MKKVLMLLIGVALLVIGLMMSGGGGTIPLGTVRVDYSVSGK